MAGDARPVLEWVNHASYVLSWQDFSIITDPWLIGPAFNEGWDPISPTRLAVHDFARFRYVWISHEHPDHFSPSTLKAIPPPIRSRLTVLFQQTRDRKVLQFCSQLGFQVLELPPFTPVRLAGATVTCGPVDDFDSWLLVDADGCRMLNLNDCVIDTPRKARRVLKQTGPVHVLVTQFGYAQWMGNPDDGLWRQRAAAQRLHRIRMQAATLRPRFLVPFASYIYFSHRENVYLNDHLGNIADVVAFIRKATDATPIVLYPGDRWAVGEAWDNEPAVHRYKADFDLSMKPLRSSGSVSAAELADLARSYLERMGSRNNLALLAALHIVAPSVFPRRLRVYLWDLERTVEFDLRSGLRVLAPEDRDADVEMASDSLAYIFDLTGEWARSKSMGVSGPVERG